MTDTANLDELRTLRADIGSQSFVAMELGLTRKTIYTYETKGGPRWWPRALMALAVELGKRSWEKPTITPVPETEARKLIERKR